MHHPVPDLRRTQPRPHQIPQGSSPRRHSDFALRLHFHKCPPHTASSSHLFVRSTPNLLGLHCFERKTNCKSFNAERTD
jgi:hypothetical protein